MKTQANISQIASFPWQVDPVSGASKFRSYLSVYEYHPASGGKSCLVLSGENSENLVNYLHTFANEMFEALCHRLDGGDLFIDLDRMEAITNEVADDRPETKALLEGLAAAALFPKRQVNLEQAKGMVSVILCGGKGSRMRSKDLHKVCFPISGKPSVNRLLDQFETVGVREHIVVVGDKGMQVVREIAEVRDNVAFVYQINENGTGNAARQAAYLLNAQGYKGNILLVLGDKVVEETAVERLLRIFGESEADVALMVADKRDWPDGGRMVYDRTGRPVDIVEKRDVQKIILSGRLRELAAKMERIPAKRLREEISGIIPAESKARLMFPKLMERLDAGDDVTFEELFALVPESDCKYTYSGNGFTCEMDGEEFERVCDTINLSVYLFKTEAFYRQIFSLGTENAQKEEYLTDVIRLLANDSEKRWKIIPVPVSDKYEVLSFNNPMELLQIEEYYNAKEKDLRFLERACERIDDNLRKRALRPVTEWVRIFEEFNPEIKAFFNKIYGSHPRLHAERRGVYLQALKKFIRVYGAHHPVIISRSPGRINLMGRHVDHQGGYTNYMAINSEVILVAGMRNDDVIDIHNIDSQSFRPRSFSISSELSRLPWDEWLNIINSEKVREMILSSHGDWLNYFRAAALRLQEKFKGRLLFGFNGVLAGKIPLAAGLSSSSAVVITAAEALTFINGLNIVPTDFVDLCGEGEWFVGTRDSSGDHTAMKFAEKGSIIHMGFHPVRIESVVPFPRGYNLFILNSHQTVAKSENAMQIFNEKITSYEAAQLLVKARYPQFRESIGYFRDISTENLGLKPYEIYDILLGLPEKASRSDLMNSIPGEDRERLEKTFISHCEPEGGYKIRRVALFGFSEIYRARMVPELLKTDNPEELGHLFNLSHNGDRVSQMKESERVEYDNSSPDEKIISLREGLLRGDSAAELHLQPGGYGCSTTLIDEMVDSALSLPGVVGAQLSGAGLGGCIMALVKEEFSDSFRESMTDAFYRKHNLPPLVEKCYPIEGSGVVVL
jgi:N-acetylgalactosamine kinase